jgi:glycosyltransferase involved in cell wall biosynthesis
LEKIMLNFSLIIATLGRTTELDFLFSTLAAQAYPNLECIVVDQNLDARVEKIVDRWNSSLKIVRVTSTPGLSHARNVGLGYATGDLIAFPDDDCWYSESLLANVSAWFEKNTKYSVLTVGSQDHDGVASGNRWIQDSCEIKPSNAFRTTFSSTIFVRRDQITAGVRFDESLGVGSGTRYACGEETDYVLNILRAGGRGCFDRALHIGHPKRDMLSGSIDGRRATGYGRGMGHVLKLHSESLLLGGFLAYDLTRAFLVAVRGDTGSAELCLRHAWGIATGYMGDMVALSPESALHSLHPARLIAFVDRLIAKPTQNLGR